MTSEEHEQSVLSFAILGEATELPENINAVIRAAPDSFTDERNGLIGAAVKELRLSGNAVCQPAVQEELQRRGVLERAGGIAYLYALPEPSPAAAAGFSADEVWTAYRERRAAREMKDATEALERSPGNSKSFCSIVARVTQALDALVIPESETTQRVLQLRSRAFDVSKEPPPFKAVFSLSGQPISTRGNLAAIAADAKAGKSAAIGAIIASTMIPEGGQVDCLGFGAARDLEGGLIHLDTEQSPDDHWHSIRRALRRAGLSEPPPWLHSYCLTGYTSNQCREFLKLSIDLARKEHGGVRAILIDGIADLVADINDPKECNLFVEELHALAIANQAPIVAVIHFNPNGTKTRGHLGSQLERKSETNLVLRKENDITVMFSTRQRRAPILESTGPRFAWSDDAGMHVTVNQVDHQSGKECSLEPYMDEVFPSGIARKYSDLVSTIMMVTEKSDPTAQRWIREAIKRGRIVKAFGGTYVKGSCEK